MAKKLDIDWKNFFLQKGEKIGLGVGVVVLGVMLVFGIKGVFSGSPSANAAALNAKTKEAQNKLVNNKPRDDSEFKIEPTLMNNSANLDEIKVDDVKAVASLFVPFAPADAKRREPKIEPATELTARYLEAQIRSYMLSDDGKEVWVIRGEDVKGQSSESLKRAQTGLMPGGGRGGAGGPGAGGNPMMVGNMRQMMGGGGVQSNPMMSRGGVGQGMRGLQFAGREQGNTGIAGSDDKSKKKDKARIPIDKLSEHNDVRLADAVLPRRMVIVEGAYPLRKQLENMMAALHSPTLADAFRELTFAGLNVQRREVGPDGKPIGEYADFGFEDALRVIARASGKRWAEDDPELKPLILPGLVYNLPEQLDERKYPDLAAKLGDIKKALEVIKEKGQTLDVAQAPEQFNVGDADLLAGSGGTQQTTGQGGAAKPGGGKGAVALSNEAANQPATKPGATAKPGKGGMADVAGGTTLNANWEPPEYCLIRFYDAVVDPGRTYEYRYQIKMRNPNKDRPKEVAYKDLADKALVLSPWFEVGQRVTIPADFHFYAVDTKELEVTSKGGKYVGPRDQVVLQLQRWVDLYNAADKRDPQPVGDWAVADQVRFSRGEFIGGTQSIEMPVWSWFDEKFVIASDPNARRQKKVPVQFTESDSQCPVLVDFSSSPATYTKPEERRAVEDKDVPRELLLLSPEGRLFVRNSVNDAGDSDRKEHFEWWKQRVSDIKNAKEKEKKEKMGDTKEGASPFSKGGAKQ
jgi:hypothetical protein